MGFCLIKIVFARSLSSPMLLYPKKVNTSAAIIAIDILTPTKLITNVARSKPLPGVQMGAGWRR